MSDGMQVMHYQVALTPIGQMRLDKGGEAYLRSRAARDLAETILAGAAVYQRFDPKEDDPNPQFIHRWSIGVQSNLAEVEAREKQMDEARRQGRSEAAAMLVAQAEVYDRFKAVCAGVLAHELREMARKILEVKQ